MQQELERAYAQQEQFTTALDRQAAQYKQRLQKARTERQTALDHAQTLLTENGRLTGELNAQKKAEQ